MLLCRYRLLVISCIIAIAGMVVLISFAAVQFYKNRYGILPNEAENRLKSK